MENVDNSREGSTDVTVGWLYLNLTGLLVGVSSFLKV